MRYLRGTIMLLAQMSLSFLASSPLAADTRPVSIGLNANREPWLARSANVGWVRMDLYWMHANPEPGVWDFADEDNRVAEARANGQQILAVLHGVPAWAGGGSHGNIPPLTTTHWSEFVRRVAQRYSGQIAAYEIWNEPNDAYTGKVGIGWDRYEWEPPLYVDFFQAAAQEIRTYSPGSQVVGLSFTSRLDNTTKRNRASAILSQMHTRIYPSWDGWCCCFQEGQGIDVLSFHNNGLNTTSSLNTALELTNGSLYYTSANAPCLMSHPVWVTEYGWRANAVTEAGQREKICNITKMYTGRLNAGSTSFDRWNITRSFIYLQKDPTTSQAIFRGDNSPTPTVTQYLRALSYPATQNPALSGEYPTCAGVQLSAAPTPAPASAGELSMALSVRGLANPASALPAGYALDRAEVERDVITAHYSGPDSDTVRIRVLPAALAAVDGSPATEGTLSAAGAEWTRGGVRIEIMRPLVRAGSEGLVAQLAATLDPEFGSQCVIETVSSHDTLRNLGLRVPTTPKGFSFKTTSLSARRASAACGTSAGVVREFDFAWTFERKQTRIRAGIYRYGAGFEGAVVNPASLHWSDGKGTRYWVAAESPVPESLMANLYEVARSMDPTVEQKLRKPPERRVRVRTR